jgi:4'-phosphopantetheinyl transferase
MVDRQMAVAERRFDWKSVSLDRQLNLTLDRNRAHLWLVGLHDVLGPNLASHYAELLTDPEISRANRIVYEPHRQLYLGGRIVLRILLSAYTGIENSSLQFGYGNRGKPRLIQASEDARLEFNYTLSRGYALYGFSLDREIGVDIEVFPRDIDVRGFARRILTEDEKKWWQTIPDVQQNESMLACWTRKEAYGKALGVGIRYAMNQVNLFTDLHHDQWCTPVTGLFESINVAEQISLTGIQLGLPVPGAASVMFIQENANTNATNIQSREFVERSHVHCNGLNFSAFQLHP